ncbi:MAG TPA: hypothetical protein GX525_10840 [Bacilli bacterium]|nr:hypothetical protein [Bacilli bacterium]
MKSLNNRIDKLRKELGMNDADTIIISINDPQEEDVLVTTIPPGRNIPHRFCKSDIQIKLGEWDGERGNPC